jgi:Domain of unknown function (DUF4326)
VVNLKGRKPQVVKPGEVYCGRNMYMGGWKLAASKWANPYKDGTLDAIIVKYKNYLLEQKELLEALPELQGKGLACWCSPAKCHCDVIAKMVNDMMKKEETKKEKEKEKD